MRGIFPDNETIHTKICLRQNVIFFLIFPKSLPEWVRNLNLSGFARYPRALSWAQYADFPGLQANIYSCTKKKENKIEYYIRFQP